MRQTNQLLVIVGPMIVAMLYAGAISAAPPKEEEKKDKAEKGTESDSDEEYRREAEKLANGIEIEIFKDDMWCKAKRIEKP
jgi:hypothetical protein